MSAPAYMLPASLPDGLHWRRLGFGSWVLFEVSGDDARWIATVDKGDNHSWWAHIRYFTKAEVSRSLRVAREECERAHRVWGEGKETER